MFIWKETYLLCIAHPAATLWIGWQTRKRLRKSRKDVSILKKDLRVWEETYVYMKRDLCLYEKRPTYFVWRIPQLRCESVDRQEKGSRRDESVYKNSAYVKRDLCLYEKRPMSIWKEIYVYVKRLTDSTLYQEIHMDIWKETYVYMKRGLCLYEKRPTSM